MDYIYARLIGRLIGYVISFIIVAVMVVIKARRWINEYKQNQEDYDKYLERQLEVLKYKNTKNKQKGKK